MKDKLENLLWAMNDALMGVSENSGEIQANVWKVYDLEDFFEKNEIKTTFDAQDIVYDIYFGYLQNDIDITYMVSILNHIINDIECEEEYEEYYYLLTDIQDNLDLEEIEIKDIYDYMDTLNRQMKTVKEMISKL